MVLAIIALKEGETGTGNEMNVVHRVIAILTAFVWFNHVVFIFQLYLVSFMNAGTLVMANHTIETTKVVKADALENADCMLHAVDLYFT